MSNFLHSVQLVNRRNLRTMMEGQNLFLVVVKYVLAGGVRHEAWKTHLKMKVRIPFSIEEYVLLVFVMHVIVEILGKTLET